MDIASPVMSFLSYLLQDVQYVSILNSWLMGQHVTLDIIFPPRPAQIHRTAAAFELGQQYVQYFQRTWSICGQGSQAGKYMIRIVFSHVEFHHLPVFGAVNKIWHNAICSRAPQLGFVNFKAPGH